MHKEMRLSHWMPLFCAGKGLTAEKPNGTANKRVPSPKRLGEGG